MVIAFDEGSVHNLFPASGELAKQAAASADSVKGRPDWVDSSFVVQKENQSVNKEVNPNTSVDSTECEESSVTFEAVVNEDWSTTTDTTQTDSVQSISFSRGASEVTD